MEKFDVIVIRNTLHSACSLSGSESGSGSVEECKAAEEKV